MKLKCIFLILMTLMLSAGVYAQITVGADEAPDQNALLDIKQNNSGTSAKGLLPPRVALQSTSSASPLIGNIENITEGMTVYNTATAGDVTPGYYFHNGERWIRKDVPKFFNMPAIVVPVSIDDDAYNIIDQYFSIGLYLIFMEQFSGSGTSAKSNPSANLPLFSSEELNYYVTYYDDTVFTDVSITNTGILKYRLINNSPNTTVNTFMNIMLEVK